MNTLLEVPAQEAETVDLRRDDGGGFRKTNGRPPDQGRSELRWLKAIVRTIDLRREDLERTHWKKVWRSMVED